MGTLHPNRCTVHRAEEISGSCTAGFYVAVVLLAMRASTSRLVRQHLAWRVLSTILVVLLLTAAGRVFLVATCGPNNVSYVGQIR